MTGLGALREDLSRLKDIDRVLVAAVIPSWLSALSPSTALLPGGVKWR
jgi:hypothetical protein